MFYKNTQSKANADDVLRLYQGHEEGLWEEMHNKYDLHLSHPFCVPSISAREVATNKLSHFLGDGNQCVLVDTRNETQIQTLGEFPFSLHAEREDLVACICTLARPGVRVVVVGSGEASVFRLSHPSKARDLDAADVARCNAVATQLVEARIPQVCVLLGGFLSLFKEEPKLVVNHALDRNKAELYRNVKSLHEVSTTWGGHLQRMLEVESASS